MIQVAFKMKLKPGAASEYRRRHDELWPEMKSLLRAEGIYDYSIFHDEETNTLFAVQKRTQPLHGQPVNNIEEVLKKWWDYMADIMEVNADNSPVMVPLEQVFYFE
jgi:L-rhamnose mutarotase